MYIELGTFEQMRNDAMSPVLDVDARRRLLSAVTLLERMMSIVDTGDMAFGRMDNGNEDDSDSIVVSIDASEEDDKRFFRVVVNGHVHGPLIWDVKAQKLQARGGRGSGKTPQQLRRDVRIEGSLNDAINEAEKAWDELVVEMTPPPRG